MKTHSVTAPILGYADSPLPYELHNDVSGDSSGAVLYKERNGLKRVSADSLGAVLYQERNGSKRVIRYTSRGLNKSEKNYSPHKREFLALKWAIGDKFMDYLDGQQFTVLTDNNPVTYVLTTAKLDATGHRWLASLASFHFDIKYRAGRQNADADAPSRLPINIETVQAICYSAVPAYVETLTLSSSVVVDDEDPTGTGTGNIID